MGRRQFNPWDKPTSLAYIQSILELFKFQEVQKMEGGNTRDKYQLTPTEAENFTFGKRLREGEKS